ncbi:LysR family transcriptional regulator, partial [Bordetella pertussis]
FGVTGFVIKPFLPALPVRSRIVRSRLRPLTRHAELLLEAYRAVVLQARPDSFQA